MDSLTSVIKIATNTHHFQHPFSEAELSSKNGRYANWQNKGILAFAVMTIFSLGIASCFFIATAYLKYRKIEQSQSKTSEQNVQNVASNTGLKKTSSSSLQNQKIEKPNESLNVQKKLDRVTCDIIKNIGEISPLNSEFSLTTGLLVISIVKNGHEIVKSHTYLPFSLKDVHLEQVCRSKIQEIVEPATKSSSACEKLSINWTVFIKGQNKETNESFFSDAHGHLSESLQADGGFAESIGSGVSGYGYIPKICFEQTLDIMGFSHDLLAPFDFPDSVEENPFAGIQF